jgi:hypothetical protein
LIQVKGLLNHVSKFLAKDEFRENIIDTIDFLALETSLAVQSSAGNLAMVLQL